MMKTLSTAPFRMLAVLFIVLTVHLPAQAGEGDVRRLDFGLLRNAPPGATVDDICCGGALFSQAVDTVTMGYGEAPVWLRIDGVSAEQLLVLNLMVDRADLFLRSVSGGGWLHRRTGDTVAMEDRAVESPFMVLPAEGMAAGTQAFLRLEQPALVTLHVEAWQAAAFHDMEMTDRSIKLFLAGILSATIIYNGFVGALLRSPTFLLNALTIGALLLFALYLSGYGAAYVWRAHAAASNHVQVLALTGSVCFGGMFLWSFMREADESYRSGWPIAIPAGTALLAAFAVALGMPYWAGVPVLLVCAAALFAVTVTMAGRRAWRGSRQARILLVPMCLAILPGLVLVALQKMAGISFAAVEGNVMEATLSLEAILFSLAIASRVRMSEAANRQMTMSLMALRAEGAAKVIAAQDAERQRLARDLHDGVAQDFLVVLGNLKRLARAREMPDVSKALPSLIQATTDALDELRRIAREMYPASVVHLGLRRALETLFENLGTANQIEAELAFDFDEAAIDRAAKLHVYRITQECLSNISRHSGASRCSASFVQRDGRLDLVIEDDGSGFDHARPRDPASYGLGFVSIDERVRGLSGTWRLGESRLGGLRVDISFPLKQPQAPERSA